MKDKKTLDNNIKDYDPVWNALIMFSFCCCNDDNEDEDDKDDKDKDKDKQVKRWETYLSFFYVNKISWLIVSNHHHHHYDLTQSLLSK